MSSGRQTIIKDLLAVIIVWVAAFLAGKAFWQFGHAPAENGLYTEISRDVPILWEKLRQISSAGDAFKWLTGFAFHLSPIEDTEKPLFTVTLGYFKLLYDALPLGFLPHYALFNVVWLIGGAFVIVRLFRAASFPYAGYAAAVLVLLDTVLISDLLCGYHTLYGVFASLLLLLLFMGMGRDAGPRQFFLAGILASALVFVSTHLIPTFLAFAVFLAAAAFTNGSSRLRAAAYLAAGLLAPFAYYETRDLALTHGMLDWFRRPDLAQKLEELGKHSTLVSYGFLNEGANAAHQNLPADYIFLFKLIRTTEGWTLLAYCAAGTLLGLFSLFSQRPFSGALKRLFTPNDAAGRTGALQRLFVFTAAAVALNIAVFASIPMPYLSRVYLPAIVLLIVSATAGYLLFSMTGRSRARAATALITAAVVLQAIHYGTFIYLFDYDISRSPDFGVVLNGQEPQNPSMMEDYLLFLKSQGKERVTLGPLAASFGHHSLLDPGVYCMFHGLKAYGLKETNTHYDGNPLDHENVFKNEHLYYQLTQGRLTGDPGLAETSVRLAAEFDIFTYYTYGIDDVIEALRRADTNALACPGGQINAN